MNELTYNILKRMTRNPLEVEYRSTDSGDLSGLLYLEGGYVLSIVHIRSSNTLITFNYELQDTDLRRILDCARRCEDMRGSRQ